MPDHTRNYFAYLLRCWQEDQPGSWRASLEDPHTGETIAFSSPQQFFDFIAQKTNLENNATPQDGAPRGENKQSLVQALRAGDHN